MNNYENWNVCGVRVIRKFNNNSDKHKPRGMPEVNNAQRHTR